MPIGYWTTTNYFQSFFVAISGTLPVNIPGKIDTQWKLCRIYLAVESNFCCHWNISNFHHVCFLAGNKKWSSWESEIFRRRWSYHGFHKYGRKLGILVQSLWSRLVLFRPVPKAISRSRSAIRSARVTLNLVPLKNLEQLLLCLALQQIPAVKNCKLFLITFCVGNHWKDYFYDGFRL